MQLKFPLLNSSITVLSSFIQENYISLQSIAYMFYHILLVNIVLLNVYQKCLSLNNSQLFLSRNEVIFER